MDIPKYKKEDLKKRRKEIIEKCNKATVLPEDEKIKFHSIILLELFNMEDFPNLIKGLDKLYGDLSNSNPFNSYDISELEEIDFDISRLEKIKKELDDSKGFTWTWQSLPPISNSRLDRNSTGISHDLGKNIHHLNIGLYIISSTLVMVKIEVGLTSSPSDELNDILYREYTEEEVMRYDPNYGHKIMEYPWVFKSKAVSNLRFKTKKEIIDYLSPFFNGIFINSSKNDISIVPSIDLYSFKYPESDEDIRNWGNKRPIFLSLFGIKRIDKAFKWDRYLLCTEDETEYNKIKYRNYVIFANKNPPLETEKETNEDIESYLQFTYFVVLAIYRLIKTYDSIIHDLNLTISREIQNLDKNKLNEVIDNRKKISEKIYYFKRFKIAFEFEEFTFSEDFPFESLHLIEEYKTNLLDDLLELIKKRINEIDNAIDTLNQNANLILDLKNIEYAKITQDHTLNLAELTEVTQNRTYWLSVIVGYLAFIQVVFGYYQLNGNPLPIIIILIVIGINLIGFYLYYTFPDFFVKILNKIKKR